MLCQRNHAELLSTLLLRHVHAISEVLIADPGRANSTSFTRALGTQGYPVAEQRGRTIGNDLPPFRAACSAIDAARRWHSQIVVSPSCAGMTHRKHCANMPFPPPMVYRDGLDAHCDCL